MGRRTPSLLISGLMILSMATPALALPNQPSTQPTSGKKEAKQKLYRADFRVSGASCVGCLRRVAKILRTHKGVLKADVSIFKPHWAIAIYNADEVSLDQLAEACKTEKVKFEEVEDKPIAEVPLIVIPKGMNKAPDGPSN